MSRRDRRIATKGHNERGAIAAPRDMRPHVRDLFAPGAGGGGGDRCETRFGELRCIFTGGGHVCGAFCACVDDLGLGRAGCSNCKGAGWIPFPAEEQPAPKPHHEAPELDAGERDDAVEALREELREAMADGGEDADGKPLRCPVCDRRAQRYRRKLSGSVAEAAVLLFRLGRGARCLRHRPPSRWVDSREVVEHATGHVREYHKLRYWKLAESQRMVDPKDGEEALWRLTARGVAWVAMGLEVPNTAVVELGQVVEISGKRVTIGQALGDRFALEDLLGRYMEGS